MPPSNSVEDAPLAAPPEDGAQRSSARRRRRRSIDPTANGTESMLLPAVLLAAAVTGSVLAIGSVHLPALAIVAAVAFAAAAIALHRQARTHRGIVLPLPALIFAALALFTLLQAIPLPMRWLEAIAPANADIWQRSLLPFGAEAPRWAPISLDPGASLVEVLRWSTYSAVFVAAATIAARQGLVWGVSIVFGASLIAALATLGHGLAGVTKVYGIYQPTFNALAWHIGPLLNPNNLAGYLNVGVLCGMGLLLSHRPPIPRWIIGLCVTLVVAIDITASSRGGVLSLVAGVVGFALLTRHRDRESRSGPDMSKWLVVTAVAGGALFAALGASDKAWNELRDRDLSKLEMLRWIKPMVRDHLAFGVGRGAFESVFPAYRVTVGNSVFTHPENFVAQWITEWGVPVALVALGTLAWAFGPRRLGAHRSALAAGAWIGVAALLLQNLVDLALEIPAVCIAAATVLGSLWGDPRMHGRREALSVPGPIAEGRARAAAIALGAAGALAIAAGLRWGAHDVAADRADLHAAYAAVESNKPEAFAPVRAELRRAMLAHPAEPYFPLLGGTIAFRARDQNPIPWIQRTLERSRVNGRVHLLLAEVLAARGAKRQALLELRLAAENDPAMHWPAAQLAVRWSRTYDELVTAVPEGKGGAAPLTLMANALTIPANHGDPVLRSQCDQEAIRRDPTLIQPRVRESEMRLDAIARGDTQGVCADRAHCRLEILEHVDAIARAHPDASVALELRARLLTVEGKPEEAIKLLEKGCDRVAERVNCLRARVGAAATIKAPEPLTAASKDLLGAACVTPQACAEMATWLATVRVGRNELGAALTLLSRAAREDPNDEARWMRIADLASKSGAHVQATDALEKVAKHRGGADPELKQRIEAERAQILGGMLKR